MSNITIQPIDGNSTASIEEQQQTVENMNKNLGDIVSKVKGTLKCENIDELLKEEFKNISKDDLDKIVDTSLGQNPTTIKENQSNNITIDNHCEQQNINQECSKNDIENIDNIEIDESTIQEETKGLLSKIKEYIQSNKFDQQCENVSEKKGVPKDIVKNATIKSILSTIGKFLNMTIVYAGDIIIAGVNFLSKVISNITHFSVDVLQKLTNALTLNCAI